MGEVGRLIGREQECERILGWLEARTRLPAALVLVGDAGIGKTTLLRYAKGEAERRGYRILASTPSSSRTQPQFTALGDLLADPLDEVAHALPEPQRRALEIALLLRDADGPPPEERAIALGLRAALRKLAERGPLLVAIDDVQWIDPASRAALEFALARLGDARIAVGLAWRSEPTRRRPPIALDRAPLAEAVDVIELAPLSLGALHALIREKLGSSLRRPLLQRIHVLSGGSPLYALELARVWVGSRDEHLVDEPALPSSLLEAVHERLASLPTETLEALTVAAMLSDPTAQLVADALDAGDIDAILRPALAAGVVEMEGTRIRFTHPLLGSVAATEAPRGRARELHRCLARLAPSQEERARHLALATDSADAEAASALEEAALGALARGAPAAAAELAEHSRRLTPAADSDSERRRTRIAAEAVWVAGDYDGGRAIFERTIARTPAGPEKARTLMRLASNPRNMDESRSLCEEALRNADTASLRAEILMVLGQLSYGAGDMDAALRHTREAVATAQAAGDEPNEVMALGALRWLESLHGERISFAELEAAAELEARHQGFRHYGLGQMYLLTLIHWDDLERAERQGERLYQLALKVGDVARGDVLIALSNVAYRSGDWQRAARLADEALELLGQYGVEQLEAQALAYKTLIEVSLGRIDAARAHSERGLDIARRAAQPLGVIRHRWVLGFLELSIGDYAAASRDLGAALDAMRQAGIRNPGAYPVAPCAVEAFLGVGDIDRAEHAVRDLEDASALGTPRALAFARRSRAQVLAARGRLGDALASFEEALEHHERLPVPFEKAITLLAQGQTLRRAKRRGLARRALEAALEIFDRLPAPLWSSKASAELARLGGRPVSETVLTPTERRIASLVAEGKANKEVAAELFVTAHTVEAALTRIYRKVGVRSRTELSRRLPHGAGVEVAEKL